MDEQKETFEMSKTIKNNIENFELFNSHVDKYTQDIFEISSPYEFLLPQYMIKGVLGELSKLFSLERNNLLNLVATSINLKELLFSSRKSTRF